MIYLKCVCGNGLGVPGSFRGESLACDDCGRSLRLVAAHDLADGRGPAYRLTLRSGPAGTRPGEQILLGGEGPIEVGKGEGKHLLLPGTLVSRSHCRLLPAEAGGWRVEDTNSRNGVFVNGTRVMAHDLQPGDVLNVGEYELHYAPVGPAPAAVPAPPPPPPAPAESAFGADDAPDAEYELAEPAPAPKRRGAGTSIAALGPATAPVAVTPVAPLGPGPACPCCAKRMAHGARICVECGIDLKSGRPLLTAQGLDEDALYVRAENTISVLSWVIPFGLYPVASEARGNSKPYAVWAIAAITLLFSVVFFGAMLSAPEGEQPAGAELMLWAGDAEADAFALSGDDRLELQERLDTLDRQPGRDSRLEAAAIEQVLALSSRAQGEFNTYQLLTHALLHGDVLHLAGNFLFLFVLGTRVNALLGNPRTAIVYPLLAVAGGAAHLVAVRDQPPIPMLGASGAVMGLAGMYLVLMPAYRVHMAIWLRLGLLTGFRLGWKLFAVRGFWVVLFYIAFDVLATALGSEDGVAHWAHLGGFLAGIGIALVLLFTRLVNAHGGDLVSVALGKYAWPLLGRPGQRPAAPQAALTPSAAA